MNTTDTLQRLVQAIEQLTYPQTPRELYEPIEYMMRLGGKRLRPLLVLLGAKVFGHNNTDTLTGAALSVEIFHNFTLMHDDIMDCAPLRRGQATVHERWGNNTAILSGDVMLVKAYQALMEVPDQHLRAALDDFNKCAIEVCEGQQLDMNFEQRPIVSETEYIEMIRLKTAVLLGFSLALGARLAGASATDIARIDRFGQLIGIGFQLKDDLLDVYGNSAKVGKQVGGDIISNKKTFLLLKALENANPSQRQTLDHWLSLTTFDKEAKVKAVREIYDQLAIPVLTQVKIKTYFEDAFALLETLQADASGKTLLRHFTEQLIDREQ